MLISEKEVLAIERTFVVTGVILAILFSILCLAASLFPDIVPASTSIIRNS